MRRTLTTLQLLEAVEAVARVDATRVGITVDGATIRAAVLALVQEIPLLTHRLVHDIAAHEGLSRLRTACLRVLPLSQLLLWHAHIDIV